MRGNALERTNLAVGRQLAAIGASRLEVGVFHEQHGMILRTWTPDQVRRSIPWLRHQNALGNHIYIRPVDSLGTVLLDDLDAHGVSAMRRDGLQPAAVVETCPGNYQCWIRLIHNRWGQRICPDLIRCLLAWLANVYRADPRCIDWRHFGRLSGFTNPKPRHTRQDGRQPYVLLRYAHPLVATRGRQCLIHIGNTKVTSPPPSHGQGPTPSGRQSYGQRQKRLLHLNRHQPWAFDPDVSRLDFMIACDMLREGVHPNAVVHEIDIGSPALASRKPAHKNDYLRRTLRAALLALHPLSRPSP